MSKITNWLPEATVLSNGTKYKTQLDNLQNIEQLINLLRVVISYRNDCNCLYHSNNGK